MFGKRGTQETLPETPPVAVAVASVPSASVKAAAAKTKSDALLSAHSDEPEPVKPLAAATNEMAAIKEKIYNTLIGQIDVAASSKLPRDELKRQIIELIGEIVIEQKLPLNLAEQQELATQIVDDMLGYGPLEPLLRDEAVTDIMVNGPHQIYVERKGKLELTNIKFRDNSHVMAIATRIVTAVGRRVDESSPICDARLKDGSRVNVIAPPLSLKNSSDALTTLVYLFSTISTCATVPSFSSYAAPSAVNTKSV